MEEYRVEVKVKNNLIVRRIEEAGFKTVGEFCRLHGMMTRVSQIGDIVNMKSSPLRSDGRWQNCILELSDILGCAPEDFFTDTQLNTILQSNKRSVQVHEAEMKFMLEQSPQHLLEEIVEQDQMGETVNKMVTTLNHQEQKVINLRFGLEGNEEHTLKQVSEIMNVTTERIRQIELRALRKMRHPNRADKLRQFLHEEE